MISENQVAAFAWVSLLILGPLSMLPLFFPKGYKLWWLVVIPLLSGGAMGFGWGWLLLSSGSSIGWPVKVTASLVAAAGFALFLTWMAWKANSQKPG